MFVLLWNVVSEVVIMCFVLRLIFLCCSCWKFDRSSVVMMRSMSDKVILEMISLECSELFEDVV